MMEVEQVPAVTIDGVLRRVGDVWTTTERGHGVITHTLKVADAEERATGCSVCARGVCIIEVQECDAWDARVVVHDAGSEDRS